MKKLTITLIFVIFVFGLAIRLYKLDSVPPSLNWDEIAAGYNAFTIFHWGKDEWGKTLPLIFESFRDYKHPVHIYLTAPFVGILGLTDFNTRLPAAVFSSMDIILVYLLAKKLWPDKNNANLAGIFAALFLAASPYHFFYSRGLWEIDFALFFFLLGSMLFFYGLEKPKLLIGSMVAFGLSIYSYHSSKIVVPVTIFLLLALYFKKLRNFGKAIYLGIFVLIVFAAGLVLEPNLLGLARVKQTSFSADLIKKTWIYQKSGNEKLATIEIAAKNYPRYFSWDYLFAHGDQNPRGGVKTFGEFYYLDAVLIPLGLVTLVLKRKKSSLFIAAWVLLAPVPGALSSLTPNSTRGVFMMGSMNILAAFGAVTLVSLWKNKLVKGTVAVILLILLGVELVGYLGYYFNEYPKKEAIEWQYGNKEIVNYTKDHPDYYKVYVDSIRQQPYIFFLFYNQTPLPEYLKTVKYEKTQSKSYNTVFKYDRYQFGGWDFVESYPSLNILYVVEPSKYTGLRYIKDFNIVKLVKYLNGTPAYYLVSGSM